ncbi:hypothetical protein AAFF_G00010120 [Aldrovandia affinis]|uniref:CAP-Gly domain-containing protein n=1 Tax=Aldrovandia affinis TaxID=143900 RepID=A0AAD7S7C7_9TELE|nr:hypothetical protein AAFF_G00010120 [Aldrovandia affinis]
MPAVPPQWDHPTAFVSDGRSPTRHPPATAEEFGPLERVSKEEGESWSDESSSSGGPLRVRSLPNSAEASWKSQKSVGSFASLPEFQRAAAVCMNVSQLSSSSSDAEQALPLDMEDGGWRGTGTGGSVEDQEKPTGSTPKPCTTPVGKKLELSLGDTVALNVQNDWRSQSALPSNNNREIMPSPLGTGVGDCSGVTKQAGTWPGRVDCGNSPDPGSPGPDTESSSADSAPLETEEGSEGLSFSSEGLSSSEDDLDQTAPGTVFATGEQGSGRHSSHLSGPGASSARCYEAALFSSSALPEVKQPNPEKQAAGRKSGMDKPGDFVSSWKPSDPGEALSEILSPVDEILSYGSAELPPTIEDDFILPSPPPACEVITWTSEEGFPPPPEALCKPQNEENPLEDPSIKSDDLPSLSEDVLLPAALVDRFGNDGDFLKVDQVTPGPEIKGYSIGQRLWECQGKGEDNSPLLITLSVAEEDEDEGSSDPLSSFRLGDRVLVCSSRPGQLRFKGPTRFANGCWAGVALDYPVGNHDGAFRGVRYFQCDKNCGVLVRAEDISHVLGEQDSDQETRADDPFSDEEPPSGTKPPRDRRVGNASKLSGSGAERGESQSQGGQRSGSSAPQACRDHSFPTELNNNPLQVPVPVCESGVSAPERSSRWQGGAHRKAPPPQVGALEAEEKESCPDYRSAAMHFSEHLRGTEDTGNLWVGGAPPGCLGSLPPNTLPLVFLERSISQSPGAVWGAP